MSTTTAPTLQCGYQGETVYRWNGRRYAVRHHATDYGDYNGDMLMDLYISNYTGEADILLAMVDNESSNDGEVRNAIFEADFA